MIVPSIVGSSLVTGTTVAGALLASAVAAIVFIDARGAGIEHAPGWALGVGAASLACFVVGDAVAHPLWRAVVGTDGEVVVTTPFEMVSFGVGVGIVLTLLVLGGYGLGTRRSVGA